MIKSIADKLTQDIFDGINSKETRKVPSELHNKASRLLDLINAVSRVEDLRIPPGNRLEMLKGNLKGFYSIRINDQWRIIFRWLDNNAYKVRIADYHK